jgi:hypothetical protein
MWRRYLIGNPVFLSRVLAESRSQTALASPVRSAPAGPADAAAAVGAEPSRAPIAAHG